MARVHKNDYGTRFEITIKDQAGSAVDISAATSTHIIFKDPNNSVSTKAATFTSDGSDGKMYWDATTGFLSVSGKWQMQGRFEDADQRNRTEVTFFYVQPILE